jgi:uncharacterized protein with HEPN domain
LPCTFKRAFVRGGGVIGEAAKKVPEATHAEFPVLEWKKSAGMRDRLIHDYSGVDYQIVWDVAANKAPNLEAKLRPILEASDRPQPGRCPPSSPFPPFAPVIQTGFNVLLGP